MILYWWCYLCSFQTRSLNINIEVPLQKTLRTPLHFVHVYKHIWWKTFRWNGVTWKTKIKMSEWKEKTRVPNPTLPLVVAVAVAIVPSVPSLFRLSTPPTPWPDRRTHMWRADGNPKTTTAARRTAAHWATFCFSVVSPMDTPNSNWKHFTTMSIFIVPTATRTMCTERNSDMVDFETHYSDVQQGHLKQIFLMSNSFFETYINDQSTITYFK